MAFLGLHNVDAAPGRKNLVLLDTLRSLLEEAVEAGCSLDVTETTAKRLVLTFDDGRRLGDGFRALLDEFGVVGIFFVCTAGTIRSYPPTGPDGAGLSADDVDYLRHRHLVGSHTLDHQDLTALDGRALDHCLDAGFEEFAGVFGFQPWLFSYPWGRYNRSVVRALAQRGISHAFAACSGSPRLARNPYLIPRVFVDQLPEAQRNLADIRSAGRAPGATAKLVIRNLGLVGAHR